MLKAINDFLSRVIYHNEKESIQITVGAVFLLIATLLITHFLLRLFRAIVTRRLQDEDKYRFKTVFSFAKYFIFLIVILTTLETSGVKVTTIIAGTAGLFIAIGLGMQKLFQDIISGIFILIDRTITVNDVVEVDGKIGKITELNLRTTRAITNDDKILIIPNHKFLSEIVYNWTQNHEVTREFVGIGVAYGTDVDLVKTLLLDTANKEEMVLNKPEPIVSFENFGDSSLDFKLHFYVSDGFNVPLIKSNLRYSILKSFNDNAITIPFPQREVHLKN